MTHRYQLLINQWVSQARSPEIAVAMVCILNAMAGVGIASGYIGITADYLALLVKVCLVDSRYQRIKIVTENWQSF